MGLLFRIIRYIRLHFLRNPRYFFQYLLHYFDPNYVINIDYYEPEKLNEIIKDGKSIIRLGDGEIYILNHGGLPFQQFDNELCRKMLEMVAEYNASSSYVLGLNRVPLSKKNKFLRSRDLLNCWLPSKIYYQLYFNKVAKYIDAAMFYDKDTIPAHLESYLLQRNIIIATNHKTIERLKHNKNFPFKNVVYIETPSVNAFTDYEKIKKKLCNEIEKIGTANITVLTAFGPAGKAMAYDLSKENVQVIDVGQGIEIAYTDNNHSLNTLKMNEDVW